MPLAGYSGTPLVKKLGIKPGMTVAVIGPPRGFRDELVGLPGDVRLTMATSKPADLVIWFVPDRKTLHSGLVLALRTMTTRPLDRVAEEDVEAQVGRVRERRARHGSGERDRGLQGVRDQRDVVGAEVCEEIGH